jgi:hypothetical protein
VRGNLKMSQKLSTGKSPSVLLQGKEGEERSFDSINGFSVCVWGGGVIFLYCSQAGKENTLV